MIRLFQLPFAAAIALLALAGCKPQDGDARADENVTRDPSGIIIPVPLPGPKSAETSTIVFCLSNAADPHQSVQANLLADMLRQTDGFVAGFRDAKRSAETQGAQLRTLASEKPKAVMILPVDASAAKDEIAALRQAGIIVIGLDASLNDGTCDTVVYCDQKKIGTQAGELIIAALKRKAQDAGAAEATGRVVQIQGDEGSAVSRARSEGFLTALKAQPGIVLVHDAPAKGDRANAALRFKEAAGIQKTIDAVYAHNDMMAAGVDEAARQAGLRESLFIVGTDGVAGPGSGIEMMRKIEIDATIHQPLLVDFASRIIIKMGKEPGFRPKPAYEIEPLTLTPGNLKERLAAGPPMPQL